MFIRWIISIITALMLTDMFAGCGAGQGPEPVSDTRLLLDTFCTVTVFGENAPALLTEALDMCEEYEALFSITLEGSDVWRVNHAGGAPVTVAPQTADIIRIGLGYGALSDGVFDITIGQVSRLWGFGGDPSVPPGDELAAAVLTVDYRQVAVAGDSVTLGDPGAWIDLGAIAKGYIAGRIAEFLSESGVAGAVIDLGGDISIIGEKPGGGPWRLGVRKPFGEDIDLLGVIQTGAASVVTSGVYERQFEQDGVLYHHILDPSTGMPVQSDVISATVVAESGSAGDVLSTIAILVGSEAAPGLLGRVPEFIGAALLLENGEILQFGDIDFEPLE